MSKKFYAKLEWAKNQISISVKVEIKLMKTENLFIMVNLLLLSLLVLVEPLSVQLKITEIIFKADSVGGYI